MYLTYNDYVKYKLTKEYYPPTLLRGHGLSSDGDKFDPAIINKDTIYGCCDLITKGLGTGVSPGTDDRSGPKMSGGFPLGDLHA